MKTEQEIRDALAVVIAGKPAKADHLAIRGIVWATLGWVLEQEQHEFHFDQLLQDLRRPKEEAP